jgi:hypothetical protein
MIWDRERALDEREPEQATIEDVRDRIVTEHELWCGCTRPDGFGQCEPCDLLRNALDELP